MTDQQPLPPQEWAPPVLDEPASGIRAWSKKTKAAAAVGGLLVMSVVAVGLSGTGGSDESAAEQGTTSVTEAATVTTADVERTTTTEAVPPTSGIVDAPIYRWFAENGDRVSDYFVWAGAFGEGFPTDPTEAEFMAFCADTLEEFEADWGGGSDDDIAVIFDESPDEELRTEGTASIDNFVLSLTSCSLGDFDAAVDQLGDGATAANRVTARIRELTAALE